MIICQSITRHYQNMWVVPILYTLSALCCAIYVFSCYQAALRTHLSVRPFVHMSVCHTFSLYSLRGVIIKFKGVIANDGSYVYVEGHGQKSKVKVTEVKTQFSVFWYVTQIWIHIWRWNDAQCLIWLRRAELPNCFSRSSVKFQDYTTNKIIDFDPNQAFPDCNPSLTSPMVMVWHIKLEVAYKRCPIVFQSHLSHFKFTRDTKSSILAKIRRYRTVTQLYFINGYKMVHKACSSIKEVPNLFSNFRVIRTKSTDSGTDCAFPECNSSLNSLTASRWCKNVV